MEVNHYYVDGTPVPKGTCVTVDHFETVFTVRIRHLSATGADTIKDLIEKKYEVVDCREVSKSIFVR